MFFTLCSPKIQEIEREPVTHLRMDRLGDADSAWRCERLQACGDIHAIAHEIVAVDDDIAEVDADAKAHAVRLGQIGVALIDRKLDFRGAPDRFDRAGELGDDAVAGASEDAAAMVGDQPIDDLAMGLQRRKRRLLILAHEPAVADHIGCKDGGHSALNAIHGHARPRGSSAILRYKPADREARKTSGAVIRRPCRGDGRDGDDQNAELEGGSCGRSRTLAIMATWGFAYKTNLAPTCRQERGGGRDLTGMEAVGSRAPAA